MLRFLSCNLIWTQYSHLSWAHPGQRLGSDVGSSMGTRPGINMGTFWALVCTRAWAVFVADHHRERRRCCACNQFESQHPSQNPPPMVGNMFAGGGHGVGGGHR